MTYSWQRDTFGTYSLREASNVKVIKNARRGWWDVYVNGRHRGCDEYLSRAKEWAIKKHAEKSAI